MVAMVPLRARRGSSAVLAMRLAKARGEVALCASPERPHPTIRRSKASRLQKAPGTRDVSWGLSGRSQEGVGLLVARSAGLEAGACRHATPFHAPRAPNSTDRREWGPQLAFSLH